jgi:hypothetical protein
MIDLRLDSKGYKTQFIWLRLKAKGSTEISNKYSIIYVLPEESTNAQRMDFVAKPGVGLGERGVDISDVGVEIPFVEGDGTVNGSIAERKSLKNARQLAFDGTR